jgi:ABC-type transporter Mla subunit MlaD
MGRILVAIIVTVGIVGGLAAYFLNRPSFQVVFADAKQLKPGDKIYLAGQIAGKVVKIEPQPEGTVAVAAHIDHKFQELMTTESAFFINQDPSIPHRMGLMVRPARGSADRGRPLTPQDRVDGIDSLFLWEGLDVADHLRKITRTEPWQRLVREFDFLAQDFKKEIEQIDIGRLNQELQSNIKALSQHLKGGLQDGSQQRIQELTREIEGIQQDLQRISNQEAKKLLESVTRFKEQLETTASQKGE